ncbi:polysaccharide biosynthesis protein [Sedimentisphaera salicampi]|uniref:polysaccharide biosynthesis protein n=1 Tax=Sedimentisphaera salicampi TaxID=1941349 RepID=UPI000B9BC7F8|nr:nucleoside-diphosphate sugar epimerase/dehydratase [Sedimentisphaera salicampi]OXU14705.1 UDP-N-acetyl-alpha-D-glucosamine C6 dehydratase [Sedimentisphaera salicampi]
MRRRLLNIPVKLLTSHKYRKISLIVIHLIVFTLAYFVACGIFNNMKIQRDWVMDLFLPPLIIILPVKLIIFGLFRQYSSLWKYVNISDLVGICTSAFFSAAAIIGIWHTMMYTMRGPEQAIFREVPESILILDMVLTIFALSGLRVSARLNIEDNLALSSTDRTNLLIAGAGDAGEMLSREIKKFFLNKYKIVGFVDDNPDKIKSIINGYEVLGTSEDIPDICEEYGVQEIAIALPSAKHEQRRRIIRLAEKTNAVCRIIPTLAEITSGSVKVSQMRKIDISDLLSRDEIKLDTKHIHSFINNKTVMVTGAGGSIGSELCRQIAGYGPKELVLLEQAENPLFEIEGQLQGISEMITVSPVIADICDRARVLHIFEHYRPDVVFHAAAHKHVPLMESNPGESVKNNVLGTKNVADAADQHKTEHFVLISSDKAVNPTSVMGSTKRIAEMYTTSLNEKSDTNFTTVRFGNVLGSSSSVVPVFQRQIDEGGPVTVTHPEMTRYFMTIPEACLLVMQAAAMGKGGEVFLLDMGEPVKILELAKDMIKLNGYEPQIDIKIEFTGVRPGEKLFEELSVEGENMLPTDHPKVAIWKTKRIDTAKLGQDIEKLREACQGEDEKQVVQTIREILPEYAFEAEVNKDG